MTVSSLWAGMMRESMGFSYQSSVISCQRSASGAESSVFSYQQSAISRRQAADAESTTVGYRPAGTQRTHSRGRLCHIPRPAGTQAATLTADGDGGRYTDGGGAEDTAEGGCATYLGRRGRRPLRRSIGRYGARPLHVRPAGARAATSTAGGSQRSAFRLQRGDCSATPVRLLPAGPGQGYQKRSNE